MSNIYGLSRIPGYGTRYILLSSGVVLHNGVKLLSTQIQNSGYEIVHLWDGIRRRAFSMHRLVAIAFITNTKNKPYVNHKDGNKKNNDVNNLEWVTPSENMWHAYDMGLMSHKGSKNGLAKLTEADIPKIRQLLADGMAVMKIGEIFGVHYSGISKIRKGEIWSHVK